MVRVVNPVTGQRALIRGKSSEVLDLQFAHMKSQILLASIEDIALHIHKIDTVEDNIICTLFLKIEDSIPDHVSKYDQINWCPYVPADETESDSYVGQLIVWTRGTSYQCYSVNAVVENYGVSRCDRQPLLSFHTHTYWYIADWPASGCRNQRGRIETQGVIVGHWSYAISGRNDHCDYVRRWWHSLLSSVFPHQRGHAAIAASVDTACRQTSNGTILSG